MNVLNRKNRKLISRLLESISKPARIQILLAIGEDEACVCHLEAVLGYRQAYISQQLMALREVNILETRRDGRFVFYRLCDKRILELIQEAGAIAGVPAEDIQPVIRIERTTNCSCPSCQPLIQVEPMVGQFELSSKELTR
jgi:ArsR family transcriptional regulator